MKLSLELLQTWEEPEKVGIDSFKGNVREFRLYLLAQKKLLEAGIIAP